MCHKMTPQHVHFDIVVATLHELRGVLGGGHAGAPRGPLRYAAPEATSLVSESWASLAWMTTVKLALADT